MQIDKKLLFVSDVASILNCSSHKVYGLIHKGELEGFKAIRPKAFFFDSKSPSYHIGSTMPIELGT